MERNQRVKQNFIVVTSTSNPISVKESPNEDLINENCLSSSAVSCHGDGPVLGLEDEFANLNQRALLNLQKGETLPSVINIDNTSKHQETNRFVDNLTIELANVKLAHEPPGFDVVRKPAESVATGNISKNRERLLEWLRVSQAKRDENNRQVFTRWIDRYESATRLAAEQAAAAAALAASAQVVGSVSTIGISSNSASLVGLGPALQCSQPLLLPAQLLQPQTGHSSSGAAGLMTPAFVVENSLANLSLSMAGGCGLSGSELHHQSYQQHHHQQQQQQLTSKSIMLSPGFYTSEQISPLAANASDASVLGQEVESKSDGRTVDKETEDTSLSDESYCPSGKVDCQELADSLIDGGKLEAERNNQNKLEKIKPAKNALLNSPSLVYNSLANCYNAWFPQHPHQTALPFVPPQPLSVNSSGNEAYQQSAPLASTTIGQTVAYPVLYNSATSYSGNGLCLAPNPSDQVYYAYLPTYAAYTPTAAYATNAQQGHGVMTSNNSIRKVSEDLPSAGNSSNALGSNANGQQQATYISGGFASSFLSSMTAYPHPSHIHPLMGAGINGQTMSHYISHPHHPHPHPHLHHPHSHHHTALHTTGFALPHHNTSTGTHTYQPCFYLMSSPTDYTTAATLQLTPATGQTFQPQIAQAQSTGLALLSCQTTQMASTVSIDATMLAGVKESTEASDELQSNEILLQQQQKQEQNFANDETKGAKIDGNCDSIDRGGGGGKNNTTVDVGVIKTDAEVVIPVKNVSTFNECELIVPLHSVGANAAEKVKDGKFDCANESSHQAVVAVSVVSGKCSGKKSQRLAKSILATKANHLECNGSAADAPIAKK